MNKKLQVRILRAMSGIGALVLLGAVASAGVKGIIGAALILLMSDAAINALLWINRKTAPYRRMLFR